MVMEARLPRKVANSLGVADPADARLVGSYNLRQTDVFARGRRGKPRLYSEISTFCGRLSSGLALLGLPLARRRQSVRRMLALPARRLCLWILRFRIAPGRWSFLLRHLCQRSCLAVRKFE